MRRPLGVTIGVILLIVSGVFSILIGLEVTKVTNFGLATALAASNVQGYGAIFSGILTLAISLGLWMTQEWAWVVTALVMVVRIVGDLWAIVVNGISSVIGYASIGSLILSLIILWYLNRANVKAAFGRGEPAPIA
jgi:hypothetical protein